MKKRVSKKVRRTYKSVSTAKVTFENTRRQKPYTVKKRVYKFSRAIATKGKNREKVSSKLAPKLRQAANTFYKSQGRKSKKIFHVRIATRRVKGKNKTKSGFSLRTRKASSKKQFDEMIDELLDQFTKNLQKYGEGLSEFDVQGFEMQVEGNYGKRKRRKKSKVISARRKSTKKRR